MTAGPTIVWHDASCNHCLSMRSLSDILAHLRQGGLAVLPTETGYMLACDASSRLAVDTVFKVKRRPGSLPLHVAVSSIEMASEFAIVDVCSRRLMASFCPGPLTTICGANGTLVDGLIEWQGTTGIRLPADPLTLQLIAALGVPLTATSLNLHGEPPAHDLPTEVNGLDWLDGQVVHAVRNDGSLQFDKPSTLVRVDEEGQLTVLREGPIDLDALRAAVGSPGPSPSTR